MLPAILLVGCLGQLRDTVASGGKALTIGLRRPMSVMDTLMLVCLHQFWRAEEGQDLVEYALLLAFIALAAVALLSGIKSNIKTLWTDVSNALGDAVTAAS